MNLQDLANEMRQKADESPFHPGLDDIFKFRRDVVIDGYEIKLTLTRTLVGRKQIYQLSMGNNEGNPALIPPSVVQQVLSVFPVDIPFPSFFGNCIQFVGQI